MAIGTGRTVIIASDAERDLSLNSIPQRLGYSSPLIKARRHRILAETQRLIGEVGVANVSMDDVASRADVAKRTLYNVFQSKERLVAQAIRQYFEDFASNVGHPAAPLTLDRMIERLLMMSIHGINARNYMRALMNVYHAPDTAADIRAAIHGVAVDTHGAWLQMLAFKGQLQSWANVDELIDCLVTLRFSLVNDWTLGLIEDDLFPLKMVRATLLLLAGSTRGASRKEVEQKLIELPYHPLLTKKARSG